LVYIRGSQKLQPSQRTASGSFFLYQVFREKPFGFGMGFESGPARRRFSGFAGILKEMDPTVL
jgi:hypothetical protein